MAASPPDGLPIQRVLTGTDDDVAQAVVWPSVETTGG
jgi:hypothetical protein